MLLGRDLRGRARNQAKRDKAFVEDIQLFDNLTGGLDLNSAATMIAPHRAKTLRNFALTEPAALVTMPGYEQFSTASLGAGRVQGGRRIYLSHMDPFSLAAFAGNVYQPDDAGVWGAAVTTGLDANAEVFFCHDREVAQVFDGVNRPQITTDGATWYDSGIDAPSVAPTLALVAGAGLIDGNEYEVAYTYATTDAFDENLVHEGNGSAVDTITITTGNEQIEVTVTGSADPKVNKVNIYARNLTTGQTVLRRVGQIDNPATTDTFTIDTEPNEISLEIPTDHDVPPATLSYAVFWKNRWWALDSAERNYLRFSQAFEPQTWPADFFIELPMERGDDIVTLVPLGDTLCPFGQTGIFLVIGQTSLDFDVRPALMAETGAFGPRAAVRVEGGIFHAGVLGGYLFDGATDRSLSLDLERGWRDLVRNVSPTSLERISVHYNGREKQVAIAVPRLYPSAAVGEYILDLLRTQQEGHSAWTTSDRDIVGYIPWDGNEPTVGNAQRIFSWPTSIGVINEERVGTTADGGDFTAEFEGPTFSTQLRETIVVQGFIEFQPADGTLAVDLIVDGQVVSTQTVDLGEALSEYGSAEYGTAVYGGAVRQKLPLMWPLDAEGSNISVKVRFTGTSLFRFFSYGFSIVPESIARSM